MPRNRLRVDYVQHGPRCLQKLAPGYHEWYLFTSKHARGVICDIPYRPILCVIPKLTIHMNKSVVVCIIKLKSGCSGPKTYKTVTCFVVIYIELSLK